jgi:hypothetical protein
MPTFTHQLGPVVNAGVGKPQTRLARRLSIVRELIDQLPPMDFFRQTFDATAANGLALADGLAFHDRGFRVSPQYNFQIDCRKLPETIWDDFHFKVRQHIRRAERAYTVSEIDDPACFVRFYCANIKAAGKVNGVDFDRFPTLFSECRVRTSGEILTATASDGSPTAMVFLVWGPTTMYYLMSTRDPRPGDQGSVSLLLWTAIQRAHQRNLVLDLDGVYSPGTAKFLTGFGGDLCMRLVVTRSSAIYNALAYIRRKVVSQDETYNFY